MGSLPKKTVERAFRQKGLVCEEATDHRKWIVLHEGKYTAVFTKVSRSPKHKDIDDTNLAKMSRQLRFRALHDFKEFVGCPITQEIYLELLKEQGYI